MLFEDGTGNIDLGPSLLRVGGGVEGKLSFAVVAEGGGFETGFARKSGEGRSEFAGGGDNFEARTGKVVLLKEFAFSFAMLADVKNFSRLLNKKRVHTPSTTTTHQSQTRSWTNKLIPRQKSCVRFMKSKLQT